MSIMHNARDFVMNNPTFVDQSSPTQVKNITRVKRKTRINKTQVNINNSSSKGSGLRKLLENSIPGASHDSSARYPPPRCHPGTRTEYVEMLTTWGRNDDGHPERIAWMKGPAGVGKSAIAQTCAEALGDKLAATFFFSRPNHRDNPDHFFTTISYQLAMKYTSYGDLVDDKISHDPTLVEKALPHQFHNLIVAPIQQLKLKGEELQERVIVVDGVDECADAKAQEDIIRIVAKSALEQSTPFLWIFLSRLEPHLVSVFDSQEVRSVSLLIGLYVSREIDGDIALFLTDKLEETSRKHPRLSSPWPSEEEIWGLVDLSDGLFACADAIARFIDDDNSAGPEEQLRDVLYLARKRSAKKGHDHPLSGMDDLYTLIMERVPPKQLQTVQWILLVTRLTYAHHAIDNANLLGLSESQFRNACRSLHPVMAINDQSYPELQFYHASFMDFLENPTRSKTFCVWSDCAATLLDEVMLRFSKLQVKPVGGKYVAELSLTWEGGYPENCYSGLVHAFFGLLAHAHLGDERLRALGNFDFRKVSLHERSEDLLVELLHNVTPKSRLIRRATISNTLLSNQWGVWFKSLRTLVYIIGHGEKKALLVCRPRGDFVIQRYSQRSIQKLSEQTYKESPVLL